MRFRPLRASESTSVVAINTVFVCILLSPEFAASARLYNEVLTCSSRTTDSLVTSNLNKIGRSIESIIPRSSCTIVNVAKANGRRELATRHCALLCWMRLATDSNIGFGSNWSTPSSPAFLTTTDIPRPMTVEMCHTTGQCQKPKGNPLANDSMVKP